MICTSFIIPAYAEPMVWLLLIAATLVEGAVDVAIMRRLGVEMRGLFGSSVTVALATWGAVLAFEGWLAHQGKPLQAQGVFAVALMIVVAEVPLLRLVTRVLAGSEQVGPLSLPHAVVLSVVGNLVSFSAVVGGGALLSRLMT